MQTTKYLGIDIDYSRDTLLPEQGKVLLTKKGFYKKEHERSPQESFARAATCYSFGDNAFAQRIYDAVSNHWFTFASPVLSNAQEVDWPNIESFDEASKWLEDNVEPDGMPISCFLSLIDDTKEGLVSANTESRWLSMLGGGIGIYPANRSPDSKSTGVMAHLRGYDADSLAYKQTASRRGSIAAYLDVTHPEIMKFLDMRNPIGGDPSSKCFNLNNAVNITDDFMSAVILGNEYELIDPKHGATGRFLPAREVWEKILDMRFETGEPYIQFIDTVNRGIPSWITHPLYHVKQSNLCLTGETIITLSENKDGSDSFDLRLDDFIEKYESNTIGEVFVKSHDLETDAITWEQVTAAAMTAEVDELMIIETPCGKTIKCTPDHKVYTTNRGWVKAGDLLEDDDLVISS